MEEPPKKPRSKIGLAVRLVAALVVSAVALWWAFRDVDLGAMFAKLGDSDPKIILLYFLAQLVIHVIRVVRWGLLVAPLGRASNRAIFSSACVGIAAAMFLPLRLGELVRPAMIARADVPFGGAMASVVAERIADGLANVGLFFLLFSVMPMNTPVSDDLRVMSKFALIGFGGACVALVLIAYARRPAMAIIRRMLQPISAKLADRTETLLGTFIDGLHPLAQPGRLIGFVVLTALYWGINGGMTTILARSYGIDVPWIAGPFAVVIVVFAVTIPAGPAFTGTMHFGFRVGLAPFGVTADQAAVVGTAVYLMQIVSEAFILLMGIATAEPEQRVRPADPIMDGSGDRGS
jgi:glycosyltransferase 2 family protein